MTAILRATLLAAFAACTIPAVATGQGTSTDSLLPRIELLERQTADLEQRVRDLEALIKTEPSRARSVPASDKWQDLGNWRRLRTGMKPAEVRALLGEPEHVEGVEIAAWFWPGGPSVTLLDGKVSPWSQPQRSPEHRPVAPRHESHMPESRAVGSTDHQLPHATRTPSRNVGAPTYRATGFAPNWR